MILSAVMVVIAALLVGFLLPAIQPPRKGDSSPADTWEEDGEATLEAVAEEQHLADEGTGNMTSGSVAADPRIHGQERRSRHRLVIGSRRSRPNARRLTLVPGGYCRRLYSAASVMWSTRSTRCGSNPASIR